MAAKKFFQDRVVLLLLTVSIFLALLCSALVVLRLTSVSGASPIIQYRENLGINAFKTGTTTDHIRFIVFAILVAGFHGFLSFKVYHTRKHFAYTLLSLGILLLILTIIVSSELIYHS